MKAADVVRHLTPKQRVVLRCLARSAAGFVLTDGSDPWGLRVKGLAFARVDDDGVMVLRVTPAGLDAAALVERGGP